MLVTLRWVSCWVHNWLLLSKRIYSSPPVVLRLKPETPLEIIGITEGWRGRGGGFKHRFMCLCFFALVYMCCFVVFTLHFVCFSSIVLISQATSDNYWFRNLRLFLCNIRASAVQPDQSPGGNCASGETCNPALNCSAGHRVWYSCRPETRY